MANKKAADKPVQPDPEPRAPGIKAVKINVFMSGVFGVFQPGAVLLVPENIPADAAGQLVKAGHAEIV